ncbi:ABC transporter permease [Arcanobacterium haemolyticum]|nr:ABC transporter permease [Arcanobacterium haemolyticum]
MSQTTVADGAAVETAQPQVAPAKTMSKMTLYRRRFLRNKSAVGGLIVFILLAIFAVAGPHITQWNYQDADFAAISMPPSPEHWFGTTGAGNDLFAQVAHGLGRSMIIAIVVSGLTTVIAAFIGAGAAFFGGRVEKVILTFIHFMLLVPSFLLIALMVAGSGGDWVILMIVLTAFGWMYQARVVWSLAISIREREYVAAARYMGVSSAKIVGRHLVPNIGSLLIINFTLGIVSTVMSETSLSFLGLGVKLPDVSLGNLLTIGANSVRSATWTFWFPAAALMLLTVSVALISDGLRDALDPNSSAGGRA